MVFSSLEFLFLYLPVTLLLYNLVPRKYTGWRNLVLLALSLVFYGWGEPLYVFLMIATISVDYVFGYLIGRASDAKRRKAFLTASVIVNIGILGFFKYYDFIISNLRLIPGLDWLTPLGLGLPIGISFYTFQALSYVVDVYRGEAAAQRNIVAFGAYVTLFPQLIAGPVVRYRDIDEQLTRRDENISMFSDGVRTFIAGLGKKVLLANTAGQLWESLRATPSDSRTVVVAWLGILMYTFQIYFDFSGYSDMAIGLGKMFGFRFLENFNYPYISTSITDFWRRWHISLSTWFREYVYIPLGGSRCSTLKTYRNLFIVWLLTGAWHGASWNYILWGLYYFVLLVIEKAFTGKYLAKLPVFFSRMITMFFVIIGWLLFVSEDLGAGIVWLGNMFGSGVTGFSGGLALYELVRNLLFIAILVIASTPYPKKLYNTLCGKYAAMRYVSAIGGAAMLLLCIAYLVDSSYNPFLYFIF